MIYANDISNKKKRKEKKMENHKPFVPVLQFFVVFFRSESYQ